MPTKKHLIIFALTLAAGSASGQALPYFPIEKHCEGAGGGFDYCVQRTQDIYQRLQARWESVPPEVRARCLKWLKTSDKPDSYYQLEGCILGSAMPPPPPVYGYAPPPPPPGYYRY